MAGNSKLIVHWDEAQQDSASASPSRIFASMSTFQFPIRCAGGGRSLPQIHVLSNSAWQLVEDGAERGVGDTDASLVAFDGNNAPWVGPT